MMAKKPTSAHVHKLVRDVAVEMAHEVYATLMSRNDWYANEKHRFPALNPARLEKRWVNEHWGDFIESARATMAKMLSGPTSDVLKDQIAEALILDKSLVRGRANPSQVIGKV